MGRCGKRASGRGVMPGGATTPLSGSGPRQYARCVGHTREDKILEIGKRRENATHKQLIGDATYPVPNPSSMFTTVQEECRQALERRLMEVERTSLSARK